MSKVFLIRNQHGQYATRKGEWVSGRDVAQVASFAHHDQALNQLFELGLRAIDLRGRVVDVRVQDNGKPVIEEFGPDPVTADSPVDAAEAAVPVPTTADVAGVAST